MITMKPAQAKDFFFDRDLVTRYMDRKTASALARAGGLVRRIAQNSMRSRKKPSMPGTPPSRHVRRGQGLTYILYVFDPKSKAVVIGPVLFSKTVNADGTTAPQTNEFGGKVIYRSKVANPHTFSIGERGPIREVSQPSPRSKRFARPVLKTAPQVQRAQRLHDEYVLFRAAATGGVANYPKRAFMGPALEKAQPKLPELWASSVQS